jgi:hypothetical protein
MNEVQAIRDQLRAGALSADAALPLVESLLSKSRTAELLILRGDLIQLSDAAPYELEDAARSYEEAARLEPENPEPLEELGHFFDAVVPDYQKARAYYLAALRCGAGEACAAALADLDPQDF